MNSSKCRYPVSRVLLFTIGLLASMMSFGDRFGGGFHPNVGVGGFNHPDYYYHNNDIGVGNYRPGNGWVAPVYVAPGYDAPAYIINNSDDDGDYNCQSTQQCDSYGNCTQTQSCD
ncbi:hypothetical protein [Legionella worsleiensis]|uniref:Uncharacterized protein n=1 Tax=Legionella worsleiensis TaxID=45076 RepID=A0A0W1AFQ9_9GAMM|nr:hypothetical protein [Legionella worsleiensis]KTD80166.1 hypothetical protein Lwor_1074 [Legionella worsleiensis]STY31810.1 Uncharacterised protein [Legionella worsleiensis]